MFAGKEEYSCPVTESTVFYECGTENRLYERLLMRGD
jgi:hypothetical protein